LLHILRFFTLQDDNRYNAGRGAHLTLKRAEKARNLVTKLPGKLLFVINKLCVYDALNRDYKGSILFMFIHAGMVEALASKTIVWEQENGIEFLYDGV